MDNKLKLLISMFQNSATIIKNLYNSKTLLKCLHIQVCFIYLNDYIKYLDLNIYILLIFYKGTIAFTAPEILNNSGEYTELVDI